MRRARPAVRLRVPAHEDAFVWHRLFGDPDVVEFPRRQDRRVVGLRGAHRQIEIGRRLGREHWGKGYVTEAARQTLERTRAAGRAGSGRGTVTGATSGHVH